MKFEKTVSIQKITELEMSFAQNELVARAKMAVERAYAPFSDFLVGCAVLLDNGVIIEGNNQENAAFPSGLCAERVALFYAGAQYPDNKVVKLAITAQSVRYKVPALLCPCGACLQVISECEKRAGEPIEILLHAHHATYLASGVNQFMPFSFELLDAENN